MKTVSINVMNLCVPCENRCRYCLLSYDGTITGIDFDRSTAYAKRFYEWLKVHRPELSFLYGFGYSMEHPHLENAIRFCQSIGSATGEFLQLDGMKFRTADELESLMAKLKALGIKLIDLTFYGTERYHDRFAARAGDFRLMMDTLRAANKVDLDVAVSVPLTQENMDQVDNLLNHFAEYRVARFTCFVPHAEGRGHLLDSSRLSLEDYAQLSNKVKSYFNRERFRPEKEWVQELSLPRPEKRVLTVTLTPDNIDYFEQLSFDDTIAYLEKLDDTYYQIIPSLEELLIIYGDPNGTKMYSARDMYLHYQKRYIADHNLSLYDINDERQCFSRRI